MLNYRANIVIFHEIAPLSARSSKKRTQKEGPAPAKWRKRTEKPEAVAAVALASAVPFVREPRTSRSAQALGKREERAVGPTEEQRGTIAEPPLRSLARRRSDRKKEEQTAQALGIFSTYRGAFRQWPPPRPPPRRRKKQGRRNRRKSSRAHTRTTPSFCFSPSPIGSNSVVYNALRVKISYILTQKQYHATTSASTPCG